MNSVPRVLAVLDELLTAAAPDDRGALWQLAEPGRELDANLVRLPAGAEVGEHQEDVLDVLLVVVAGGGRAVVAGEELDLTPTTVLWLPRTSRRALVAGPGGLAYLTVHRRRPGLTIKSSAGTSAPFAVAEPGAEPVAGSGAEPVAGSAGPYAARPAADEGGEAPCMLDLVCPACGRLSADPEPVFCSRCGERFAER
ncbi:hypothetical protein AB0E67_29590 [Streptomyces sp. NPDC032161]|uniref:hypothetical protein n=1 Tax=unclassified Streptomyces TaxID=2593676 RepID=UPI0033D63F68